MAAGATVSAPGSPHGVRAARRARARTPRRRRPRAARSGSCRALDSRPGRPRRSCAVRFSCSRRRERPPPSRSVADHPSRCSLADGSVTYASTAKEERRPELAPHRESDRAGYPHASRRPAAVPPSPDRSRAARTPRGSGRAPGMRERVHDLRSDASRSDMQVNASEVAHHDPTHADHNALETHVARFPIRSSRSRSSPASRLRLPSPPSTSAVLIASLVPSSWSSCSSPSLPACRRPASGLPPFTPGLPCPVFVCRSRKGGPARSGGPPFLESPGVERNLGRRRGGGPLISKDQHQEINTRRSTPHPGCRCVPGLLGLSRWAAEWSHDARLGAERARRVLGSVSIR